MRRAICFDDVLLEPRYSDIETRVQIDLSTELTRWRKDRLRLPIISAPMDTVTGAEMANAMHKAGALGILHRYNTIEEQVSMVEEVVTVQSDAVFGAAVGITGDFEDRATALYEAGCNILCLDVAHGHHFLMKSALDRLQENLGKAVHLMAGNVATLEAFNDLADWGADSVRVGVGGGCFIAGTMVLTEGGLRPIEEIEVGESVYTHIGHLRPVTKTFTHEKKNDLVAVNGIKSTPNHEYYVLHKSNLEKANDNNIHQLAQWIKAEDLTRDYMLLEIK